jgi:PRTRC genetic system ThiF family protein
MAALKVNSSFITNQLSILVIGAGGTGSEFMSKLFKLNIINVKLGGQPFDVVLADGDTVDDVNLGRQGFYPCDLSQYKSEVLINRFNTFGGTEWRFSTDYVKPTQLNIRHYDLVVTCVDSGKFRAELGVEFSDSDTNTLWLDGGNDNDSGQIVCGHIGQAKNRHPNVWDLFGDQLKANQGDDTPSCSTEMALSRQTFGINSMIAEVMIQMLWQLLRTTELIKTIAYVDLGSLDITSVESSKELWGLYGYKQAS